MNTKRQERVIGEHEAAEWIRDGMTIAIGQPAPMALVRAMIRRGVRNLTVVDSGYSLDILIAAGCVRKVVSYYAGGGAGAPVTPSFRRAAERGEIEVWECEEGILCAGLQAAAQMLPFMPWRGGVGTSLPEVNPDLKVFRDPIRGEELIAVPPIAPDVTILHAAAADAYGNVRHLGGPGWIDLFMHRAANRTIVQVEQVVSNEEIRANPWATTIPCADAIVRAPFGAHPFYSRGFYTTDAEHLRALSRAAEAAAHGESGALDEYMRRYCIAPAGLADYLEQVGMKRLLELHEY
ncbi:MAG TPA: CoA-transferase [Candidatus Binataceae bacterium]|nr:CoA-transferase [Candidatus Binataceae bacterium]